MTGPETPNSDGPTSATVLQLVDAFVTAQRVIDESKVPDDLRSVAFARAVDVLLQSSSDDRADRGGDGPPDASFDGARDPAWQPIVQRSKVPLTVWQQIVRQRDDQVELLLSKSRLSSAAKHATRELALVLGAVRQGLGWEEATPLDTVRDQLKRYGRYSSGHFKEYIAAMDDVLFTQPDGTYRLLPDAWEQLPELLQRLTGSET